MNGKSARSPPSKPQTTIDTIDTTVTTILAKNMNTNEKLNADKMEFIDEVKLDIDRIADLSLVLADIILESSDIERVDRYYSMASTISNDLRSLGISIERHNQTKSITLN